MSNVSGRWRSSDSPSMKTLPIDLDIFSESGGPSRRGPTAGSGPRRARRALSALPRFHGGERRGRSHRRGSRTPPPAQLLPSPSTRCASRAAGAPGRSQGCPRPPPMALPQREIERIALARGPPHVLAWRSSDLAMGRVRRSGVGPDRKWATWRVERVVLDQLLDQAHDFGDRLACQGLQVQAVRARTWPCRPCRRPSSGRREPRCGCRPGAPRRQILSLMS